MWLGRLRGNFQELHQECAQAARAEEEASFELTRSAREFSRRTQEVAEDKLSFSATLMRAGEVYAANRLIEEFEADVKAGEAALAEQMNEVKVAKAARRDKVTRLRLVRTMAVAMAGACFMSLSAAGFAVAGFVEDLRTSGGSTVAGDFEALGGSRVGGADTGRIHALKRVRLPNGRRLAMDPVQYERFKKLTSGGVDSTGLEQLLSEIVGPQLAAKLAQTLASAATTAETTLAQAAEPISTEVKLEQPRPKKKTSKVSKKTEGDAPEEGKESKPEPEPAPPEQQPTPNPTQSGEDDDGGPNSLLPTDDGSNDG